MDGGDDLRSAIHFSFKAFKYFCPRMVVGLAKCTKECTHGEQMCEPPQIFCKDEFRCYDPAHEHCGPCPMGTVRCEGGCIPEDAMCCKKGDELCGKRLSSASSWSYTSLEIFDCLLSRAIHLDIATDYSIDSFLLVLRRFI